MIELARNCNLESLDSGPNMEDEGINKEGCKSISKLLTDLSSVNILIIVNPTMSGNYKSSEPYCEWEL